VNDDDMLAAMRSTLTRVKDSLPDVYMDRPSEAITARARTRRLRRGLAGAGAAAVVALAAGLALALPGGPAAARQVHVNLDAWSVDTMPSGLVNLTIRELQDATLLRQTLADAGVPALVNSGEWCLPTTPPPQTYQVQRQVYTDTRSTSGEVTIVIDPAAIPAGWELDFGIVGATDQVAGVSRPGRAVAFTVMPDGAPLTCVAGHGTPQV
jgi:hypothetical protein